MKRVQVKLTYTIRVPDDFDIEQLTQSTTLATEGLWMITGPTEEVSIETPVHHNIRVLKPERVLDVERKQRAARVRQRGAMAHGLRK